MLRAPAWAGVVIVAAAGNARADGPGPVVPVSGQRHRPAAAPLYGPPACPPSGAPFYTPDVYPPSVLPGEPQPPGSVAPPEPGGPPAVPPAVPADIGSDIAGPQVGGGGTAGRMFNEAMDGDFGGVFYSQRVVVGTQTVRVQTGTQTTVVPIIVNGRVVGTRTVVTPVFGNVTVPRERVVLLPVAGRYAGIRIADNDSPRPTDRLYFGYNFYDGFGAALNPGFGGVQQNRQTIGVEKTFLGGDASAGLRLPFVQLDGPAGFNAAAVGDLTVSLKYAFVNDRVTGNVVSAGLMLTTPTGDEEVILSDGSPAPHSVIFQPWAGFVRTFDRAYLQGVSNLFVPTDGRDVLVFSNTLAVGYWLYRSTGDRLVNGVVPTFEVHVHTPLNNRNPNGLVFLQDQVNLTGGLHVRFPRATLAGAVTVPVVGPRPWDIEALANLTFRF